MEEWVILVFPAILVLLLLLYQDGGGVEIREACFNTISLYVSISVISLTVAMPFPSYKLLEIFLFCVILGCNWILSFFFPRRLMLVTYLSCIRPLFHILPNSFQDRFLDFSRTLLKKSEAAIKRGLGSRVPSSQEEVTVRVENPGSREANPDADITGGSREVNPDVDIIGGEPDDLDAGARLSLLA